MKEHSNLQKTDLILELYIEELEDTCTPSPN